MNVLVLTAYPPVLHMHGGGVRMYHNIRLLAEVHKVRVISFVESEQEREMLKSLEGICESVTAVRRVPDFRPHWLSLNPFLMREFSNPEMQREVDRAFALERVDVLQCEYLQMAQYRKRGTFSVLTIHETLSANARAAWQIKDPGESRLKLFYRWMQILRYEVMAAKQFDRVVTMTAHDAAYLYSYAPAADIRAIPIGIDSQEFEPYEPDASLPLEVLFVGNFRHTPNGEAARFLVNEVAPFFPSIRFVLPGANVPEDLVPGPNVVFPGYVPNTRMLYRRPNTIVAAPLFSGTGQRVKLLEAFAMACPVITTTVGALGFPVRSGTEAFVADTAGTFRSALESLVASEELRRDFGNKGRAMIIKEFTWEKIAPQMLGTVEAG